MNVADKFGLTGRQAETALREARMTVNRNALPFDKNGPWYTSGVRIGPAAVTTLGMKEPEMKQIAKWMVDLFKATKPGQDEKTGAPSRAKAYIDPVVLTKVHKEVSGLLHHFPLYPELVID